MKLYFLRHAQAVEGTADVADHDRELTESGRQRTQIAARVMKRLGLQPAHIYSSPRVRAVQTAEIVAQALRMRVELTEQVNFGFSLSAVADLIAGVGVDGEVMFVGHEPSMSGVVHALTGGAVTMKKGGLARVDVLDDVSLQGALVWLIAPAVFDVLDG